jgi:hypothetical protein
VPVGAGNFSLHHHVQTGSEAHPASYPMGIRGFSLGVKRPGRKTDHSPPYSDVFFVTLHKSVTFLFIY